MQIERTHSDDGSELQARIERLWEKLGIGKEK
jgi:hypothetical protein